MSGASSGDKDPEIGNTRGGAAEQGLPKPPGSLSAMSRRVVLGKAAPFIRCDCGCCRGSWGLLGSRRRMPELCAWESVGPALLSMGQQKRNSNIQLGKKLDWTAEPMHTHST
ncbi:hypothetical protein F2P81_007887 [Scophthalmus maximus]|uniref:Uncharacterized protein n=1 Tax=Scophthalmus maximus TaxID=52904 RepID=A0A6A4TBR0_SCOMX|nr:hypothetical protein F2P81_007887 [Scophthalmus maximus]